MNVRILLKHKVTKNVDQDNDAVIMTPNAQNRNITIRTNRKMNFQIKNSIDSVLGFQNEFLEHIILI